ncbi:hypothetical protein QN277_011617 [Acacia crassicarpa]|uniref:protein-serine/threonine phosphatase n=1 Tax=Acacia crassicarpa TaxID=499986 RepID=A0AAE1TCI5_9FABA|nr:hypothetical protein QN277_011617 [Acacia crassicarpa]
MVVATFRRIVSPCWRPSKRNEGENNNNNNNSSKNGDSNGRVDGLLWYKDSGKHVNGEFSMAVVQANNLMEDQSQIESGCLSSFEDDGGGGIQGTFVGIYDGHGGPEAACFVNDHLFKNLKRFTSENNGMSGEVIKKAFLETEEEFLGVVKQKWEKKPLLASVGCCCLVGVICNGMVYVANAGDSRAVLGRLDNNNNNKGIKAIQLSSEHNASIESVRDELRSSHPDDPDIVVLKHRVWRVKGIIQVSRSIGDAYLKRSEFNREPLLAKFRVREPFEKPIMKAEPTISVQKHHPDDQFLILASDGLWEHLTNQEAVEMVYNHPRNGIGRRLVKAALCEAAKKREMRYSDLNKIERGVRRHFHDDITVTVLFLDSHLITRTTCPSPGPSLSLRTSPHDDNASLLLHHHHLSES